MLTEQQDRYFQIVLRIQGLVIPSARECSGKKWAWHLF